MPVAKKKTTKKKAAKKKATTKRKTVARRKPAKRKTAAKRKPAKRKTAAKKKPAKRKAATRRKPAKRKTAAKKKPARRKAAAKKKPARKKAAAKKKPAKKAKVKRKPNPAFMRPWTPSDALAAVVGSKPLPRTEVTKKLWAYIKRNNLQDAVNRRMINADDNLKRVFGKAKVNMFEMTKLVGKHLK